MEPVRNSDWLALVIERTYIKWVLGLVLLGGVYAYLLSTPINLDVAWFLHSSGRIFDGAKLYIDIYDNHPPMVFYFNLPAIAIARLTGWPDIPVFYAYLILLICLSSWLSWSMITIIYQTKTVPTRYCIFISLIFVSLVWSLPVFGQREHILFILTMPYILAAMARSLDKPLSPWLAAFMGILAGIGLCFKPYFPLLWILIEAYLIFGCKMTRSWRRIENLAIFLVSAIYVIYVFAYKSEYLKMVTLARKVYSAYDVQFVTFIRNELIRIWLLAGLTLVFLKRPRQDSRPLNILFIASTAFLVTALVQMKGWPNHMYPCLATSILLISTNLFCWLEQIPSLEKLTWHGLWGLALVFLLGIFIIGGGRALKVHFNRAEDPVMRLIPLVKNYAYGKPIYVMSTALTPTFPLVNYSGARFPYRFSMLWALPGFYRHSSQTSGKIIYHRPAQMEEFERLVFDAVISDLISNPPVLLIVDQNKEKIGFGKIDFDLIAYFSQDPRFVQFLSHYRALNKIDEFMIYQRYSSQ